MQTDSLQALAVRVAQVRFVEEVLKLVVDGLAAQPGIALARIWLALPDNEFSLAASAGTPLDKEADWSRPDGEFSRFRAGEKKVGHIGATGESILLTDVSKDSKWLARPDWAERERIVSFAGHPLTFRDEILGVLAVFSRAQLGAQDFKWLRIFADSAAVAIANARAFEEIDRLRRQLEQENDYLRGEVEAARDFGDIVGRSGALQKVLRQVELVAQSEAAVILSQGKGLSFDLPAAKAERNLSTGRGVKEPREARERVLTADELRQLERENIVRALEEAGQKVYGPGGAAELLQMKPTTLMSRIKALGIR